MRANEGYRSGCEGMRAGRTAMRQDAMLCVALAGESPETTRRPPTSGLANAGADRPCSSSLHHSGYSISHDGSDTHSYEERQDQPGQDGLLPVRHCAFHARTTPLSPHALGTARLIDFRTALTHTHTQQERFRNAIYGFPEMVAASKKMVKAAGLLEIPVSVQTRARKRVLALAALHR